MEGKVEKGIHLLFHSKFSWVLSRYTKWAAICNNLSM